MRKTIAFMYLTAVLLVAAGCGASIAAKAGKASAKMAKKTPGITAYRMLSDEELRLLADYAQEQRSLTEFRGLRLEGVGQQRKLAELRSQGDRREVSTEELSENFADRLDHLSLVSELPSDQYDDEKR